jgi:hypothetical protein
MEFGHFRTYAEQQASKGHHILLLQDVYPSVAHGGVSDYRSVGWRAYLVEGEIYPRIMGDDVEHSAAIDPYPVPVSINKD